MAEWLRRWIANPLLFERESSNLSDVVLVFIKLENEGKISVVIYYKL